uniref:Uncharacterized protein n=1 Tax=Avena sativa TaxID=4498 RepID=A0ACD5TZ70_AVESA
MGKHGARRRSMATELKVLVPGFSEKLPISDQLAECFDSGDGGAGMTAFLVSPFGTAVWHVEVGRDGHGAFLGRRWPEFVEAHGIGVGWFLVLRHVGRGVLTVKAFDANGFLKEFGQTLTVPGVPAPQIETGRARKPQFIRPLWRNSMEKMPIPSEFLKRGYISDEELNGRMATFVTPFRDFWHIELEKDGSNVFFAGAWSKFLEFQGIKDGEALLIRYQGNMIFTIEVFGFNGCRRNLKHQGIRFQQTENSEETNSSKKTEESEEANSSKSTEQTEEANSSQSTEQSVEANSSQNAQQTEEANSSQNAELTSKEGQSQKEANISSGKRKQREEKIMPKSSTNPLDNRARKNCEYETGSQPWIRKQLNANSLRYYLVLPGDFCVRVGFLEKCTIKLKTSERNGSWEVNGCVYKPNQWKLSKGWRTFCRENELKVGDVCTFNVVKSTLWHVDIERC